MQVYLFFCIRPRKTGQNTYVIIYISHTPESPQNQPLKLSIQCFIFLNNLEIFIIPTAVPITSYTL